jgi:hypothetical protein
MKYEFLDYLAVFGWLAAYVVVAAHFALAVLSA